MEPEWYEEMNQEVEMLRREMQQYQVAAEKFREANERFAREAEEKRWQAEALLEQERQQVEDQYWQAEGEYFGARDEYYWLLDEFEWVKATEGTESDYYFDVRDRLAEVEERMLANKAVYMDMMLQKARQDAEAGAREQRRVRDDADAEAGW